jgi:hypothetical protein
MDERIIVFFLVASIVQNLMNPQFGIDSEHTVIGLMMNQFGIDSEHTVIGLMMNHRLINFPLILLFLLIMMVDFMGILRRITLRIHLIYH